MQPEAHGAKTKVKVSMAMQVRRADGTVEDHGQQFQKTVELDYDAAVALLGQDHADEIFKTQEGRTDADS